MGESRYLIPLPFIREQEERNGRNGFLAERSEAESYPANSPLSGRGQVWCLGRDLVCIPLSQMKRRILTHNLIVQLQHRAPDSASSRCRSQEVTSYSSALPFNCQTAPDFGMGSSSGSQVSNSTAVAPSRPCAGRGADPRNCCHFAL